MSEDARSLSARQLASACRRAATGVDARAGDTLMLAPVLQESLPAGAVDVLRACECVLRRQASSGSDEGGGSSSSTDDQKESLVQLPADPDSHTPSCTRRVCCSSFETTSDAADLRLYWSRHQHERQHFDAPQSELERSLRDQLRAVDAELKSLTRTKSRVDHHIRVLHEYNEIKDVVQALMGKCAELEGRTTRDMYDKFGLQLDD